MTARKTTFPALPALACFAAAMALVGGCDPMANIFDPVESVRADRTYTGRGKSPAPAPTGDTLHVMTWNVKFAGGRIDFWFDCFGKREVMTREEALANLEGLAKLINHLEPDIMLLQEVDVQSFRVGGVDMMQYFVDNTDLGYGVYASHWRSQFIPVNNLRNMDSGNAILSKWPLTNATRFALPLRTDTDDLTRQFYLKRNMLTADVDIPTRGSRTIVDIHTEAYAKDGTKKKHIEAFEAKLDELEAGGKKFIAGGDLNSIPPGTAKTNDFPDQVCTDPSFPPDKYDEEQEWLRGLYTRYDGAIPLTQYAADNTPWLSFTANKKFFWNRTLDHLFTNGKFVATTSVTAGATVSYPVVHQKPANNGPDPIDLSDHAPLSALYDLTK